MQETSEWIYERIILMSRITFLKCFRVLGIIATIPVISLLLTEDIRAVSPQTESHKIVAYYFHTNTRCSKCKKIEKYSIEAIRQGFPNELKSGKLELHIINYEKPENRHYLKDYKLVTKSLILVHRVNGEQTEWTNLKLVWELTNNKTAFINYVRKEVGNYISKG